MGYDSLDKHMFKQMLEGPKTLRDMVISLIGKEHAEGANARRTYMRLKYRIELMTDAGHVIKDKKTSKYKLPNHTIGNGVVRVGEKVLDVGQTILIHHNPTGTSVIFLEEEF